MKVWRRKEKEWIILIGSSFLSRFKKIQYIDYFDERIYTNVKSILKMSAMELRELTGDIRNEVDIEKYIPIEKNIKIRRWDF